MWQHSGVPYDEVLHVPLMVKWPSGPSGRSDAIVSQLNLFPTLLRAADLPSPFPEKSLSELLDEGGTGAALSEIVWEPNDLHGVLMTIVVRQEEWKYIATFGGDKDAEPILSRVEKEELYDLSRDPEERTNVLTEATVDVSSFRRTSARSPRRGPASSCEPWRRDHRSRRGTEGEAASVGVRGPLRLSEQLARSESRPFVST